MDTSLRKPLPEQAAAMARARRWFGIRKRQGVSGLSACSGLGIIDTDSCLWARTVRPDDVETLFLVPSLPTMKMKPAPATDEYEEGIVEDSFGFVCTVNRIVNAHPILSALGLAAAWLLGTSGGNGKKKPAGSRKRVTVRKRSKR